MSVALRIYEQLTDAGEDKVRAKAIAEAFEHLEAQYPHLRDVATNSQVRETELRLQKDIKEVEGRLQVEIREVENRLQVEIREVESRLRVEIREVDARLQAEIKNVEVKLAEARADLVRWVVGVGLLQSTLIIGVLLKVAHLI